ncbi:MAG: GTP-binding protein [bacterium]
MNPIPITIFTGFLGAGKTTIINQLVKENPDIKFGFIINEFGEEGIDGQLIENTGEEMVELSNGCICCVVRGDLIKAAEKVINTGKVDYLIIEASGLAEPMPIAQTFYTNNLQGRLNLDGVICIVDALNFKVTNETYRIAAEQIESADIIILNKTNEQETEIVEFLIQFIQELNPYAVIINNIDGVDSKLVIDTGKWSPEKLSEEEEHHHEHDDIDEVVFVTDKYFDIKKLDEWMENKFPLNVVRVKGFLRVKGYQNEDMLCLMQVVGAKKEFKKFNPTRKDFDYSKSRIVFIGKNIEGDKIKEELNNTLI